MFRVAHLPQSTNNYNQNVPFSHAFSSEGPLFGLTFPLSAHGHPQSNALPAPDDFLTFHRLPDDCPPAMGFAITAYGTSPYAKAIRKPLPDKALREIGPVFSKTSFAGAPSYRSVPLKLRLAVPPDHLALYSFSLRSCVPFGPIWPKKNLRESALMDAEND